MNVTAQENEKYRIFVNEVAIELGLFEFQGEDIVWHYTNSQGLLGIIQSSTLYATQVSSLNDTTETKYATDLYTQAISELMREQANDLEATQFFATVLSFVKEEPESPTLGLSKFFVTCFSGDDDELTQWDRYTKPNGYAIGFYARGLHRDPNSQLYKVIYDRDQQVRAARKLAQATLDFYRGGLVGDRIENPSEWARVFFAAWDEWVYKLAPLAKDRTWRSENEYRLVHELRVSEFSEVRFSQKPQVLARYIPLRTSSWVKRRAGLLPIAKVKIGPGNHKAFTAISVRLLLEQMGYQNVTVETTKCTVAW